MIPRLRLAGSYLCLAVIGVLYLFAWAVLLHPDRPISPLWFLVGAATVPIIERLRVWVALLVVPLAAVFVWHHVPNHPDFWSGVAAYIVVAWSVHAALWTVHAWRGLDDIDLTNLDTVPEPKIVGLTGYGRSGKDTAAGALLEQGWTRVAFADTVREFAYRLNPLIPMYADEDVEGRFGVIRTVRLAEYVDHHGWDESKKHPEVRALLQRLGTDCGRELLGEDVWVDAAMRDLPSGHLVFTDVRFANEIDALRALGGSVVRVNRPGTGPVNSHVSDTGIDALDVDLDLWNTGTIAELHEDVNGWVARAHP